MIIRSIQVSLSVLIQLFFISLPLKAVVIQQTSSFSHTISSKKIEIRFILEPHEQGIVKQSLNFSTDYPKLSLDTWDTSIQPINIYNHIFKKTKLVFTKPFTLWIKLISPQKNLQLLRDILTQANLYIMGFVVQKDETIKPFNIRLPLVPEKNTKIIDSRKNTIKQKLVTIQSIEMKKTTDLEKGFETIENIGRTYYKARLFLSSIIFSWTFYIFLILLLVIFMLKKRTLWAQEVTLLLLFLFCCGGINLLSKAIQPSSALFIISVFCFVGMLYCFSTQYSNNSKLERIKNLLGLLFGSMVLPLIIKGYLLHNGF